MSIPLKGVAMSNPIDSLMGNKNQNQNNPPSESSKDIEVRGVALSSIPRSSRFLQENIANQFFENLNNNSNAPRIWKKVEKSDYKNENAPEEEESLEGEEIYARDQRVEDELSSPPENQTYPISRESPPTPPKSLADKQKRSKARKSIRLGSNKKPTDPFFRPKPSHRELIIAELLSSEERELIRKLSYSPSSRASKASPSKEGPSPSLSRESPISIHKEDPPEFRKGHMMPVLPDVDVNVSEQAEKDLTRIVLSDKRKKRVNPRFRSREVRGSFMESQRTFHIQRMHKELLDSASSRDFTERLQSSKIIRGAFREAKNEGEDPVKVFHSFSPRLFAIRSQAKEEKTRYSPQEIREKSKERYESLLRRHTPLEDNESPVSNTKKKKGGFFKRLRSKFQYKKKNSNASPKKDKKPYYGEDLDQHLRKTLQSPTFKERREGWHRFREKLQECAAVQMNPEAVFQVVSENMLRPSTKLKSVVTAKQQAPTKKKYFREAERRRAETRYNRLLRKAQMQASIQAKKQKKKKS